MNYSEELRSIQEAYMEVVENQQLDEGYKEPRLDRKEFVKLANKRSGFSLGSTEDPHGWREPEMEKVAKEFAARTSSARRSKRTGKPDTYRKSKEAQSKLKKEQVDIYDIILSHLLDEGYAETPEAAEAIMVNMSEEWRQSIVG